MPKEPYWTGNAVAEEWSRRIEKFIVQKMLQSALLNHPTNASLPFDVPSFMGPALGRSHHERFQDHSLYPQPHHFASSQSYEIQEAIEREREKWRIREEMLISEIVRQRMIESEVRRELMMERDLALRRGSNGFSLGLPSAIEFDSHVKLPDVGSIAGARLLDQRNVLSHSERERLNAICISGLHNETPFQRGAANLRVPQVKYVSEEGKANEQITLLAKPDDISGSKRKAVLPLPAVDANEQPSIDVSQKRAREEWNCADVSRKRAREEWNCADVSQKRAREEWSCALCQVSATSERTFNAHLVGKKHKKNEAKLKAEGASKNHLDGVLLKTHTKSPKLLESVDPYTENGPKLTCESLPCQKAGKTSSETDDQGPSQQNLCLTSLNKNHPTVSQTVQKNDDTKKKKFKIWCELCHIGANSEKVMDAHKQGKKHMFQLRKNNQNGEAGPSDQTGKTVNHVRCG